MERENIDPIPKSRVGRPIAAPTCAYVYVFTLERRREWKWERERECGQHLVPWPAVAVGSDVDRGVTLRYFVFSGVDSGHKIEKTFHNNVHFHHANCTAHAHKRTHGHITPSRRVADRVSVARECERARKREREREEDDLTIVKKKFKFTFVFHFGHLWRRVYVCAAATACVIVIVLIVVVLFTVLFFATHTHTHALTH